MLTKVIFKSNIKRRLVKKVFIKPEIIFINVDLQEPDWPIRATNSFFSIEISIFFKALIVNLYSKARVRAGSTKTSEFSFEIGKYKVSFMQNGECNRLRFLLYSTFLTF